MLSWLNVLPKVLLATMITVMDEAYLKLAIWLNDKGKRTYIRSKRCIKTPYICML